MHKNDKDRYTMMQSTDNPTARREFLRNTGLAAGALLASAATGQTASPDDPHSAHAGQIQEANVKAFQFAQEPLRQRKSFHDLTEEEVRRLCRAVGYMRNGNGGTDVPKNRPLSISSPLQWDQWVTMHAKHCTEAQPGVVDQVHWSWFFLPWHRAYLWFLERQLANIVTTILGEDGSKFALPYWDWIEHKEIPNTKYRATNGIPSPLFGFDLTKEDMVNADGLGFDNTALWDGYRKPNVLQPTMDPQNERSMDSKEHIEETILYMSPAYIQYMLQLDFEDFAGKAVPPQSPISNSDGMGVLEHYPHNNGHDWVGSRIGKNRNMGTLRYAALDPIFFMHHANLDRIWSWYRGTQPDPDMPWGPNKYVWGRQPYRFTDIDGSVVTITVRDVIRSMTNVQYVGPQLAATEAAPKRALRTDAAKPAAVSLSLAGKAATLTTKPVTINVEATSANRKLMGTVLTDHPRGLTLLLIETGPVTYTGKFSIKVFINKPDADATASIHDPHYIGTIHALDSEGRAHEKGADVTHSFSILIPPGDSNFFKLVKPQAPFSVTLVPLGPPADDENFQILVKGIKLKPIE